MFSKSKKNDNLYSELLDTIHYAFETEYGEVLPHLRNKVDKPMPSGIKVAAKSLAACGVIVAIGFFGYNNAGFVQSFVGGLHNSVEQTADVSGTLNRETPSKKATETSKSSKAKKELSEKNKSNSKDAQKKDAEQKSANVNSAPATAPTNNSYQGNYTYTPQPAPAPSTPPAPPAPSTPPAPKPANPCANGGCAPVVITIN
jgi:cytoskeletal protein RodZ